MTYRAEFHRRVVADIAPAHAAHALDGLEIDWSANAWGGCDTCGPESSFEVYLHGGCGCGARLSVTAEMNNQELALFMQRITA